MFSRLLLHLLSGLHSKKDRITFYHLSVFFYNIFLALYRAGIRIAALWNPKARLWVDGRKKIFSYILNRDKKDDAPVIWMHCSSLGEFEQGRPVLEKLKRQYPHVNTVLTFFSPSGFEIRKDYKGATWVFYLPADSPSNAKKFLDLINPRLVVFVKYDYWYHYLFECKKRNIPLLMVSAIFRKGQPFFKWYGVLYRKMLKCFTHFFVQDENSRQLLETAGIKNVTVAGDTRFDRVSEIAAGFQPQEIIEKFCGNAPVLVAGSTWPDDEKMIKQAVTGLPDLRLIIAPHETDENHLNYLKELFPVSIRFSELTTHNLPPAQAGSQLTNFLIIDNIGMLSRLYHYASIAYVGGGLNKGVHNTLEAAVHGKPVLFGPNYKKFKEIRELIAAGGGTSVSSAIELSAVLKRLLTDKEEAEKRSRHSSEFVSQHKGATGKIIDYVQENRLLTS